MVPAVFLFLAGVIILLISTEKFIKSAEKIAFGLKISPLIVGTTIVALGTSLPELVVSGISLIQKDSGLAVGNIVGSNIANIMLMLPFGILLGNIRIGTTKTQKNMLILMMVSILFFAISTTVYYHYIGFLMILSAIVFSATEYRWGLAGRNKEDRKMIVNSNRIILRDGSLIIRLLLSLTGIIAGGSATVYAIEKIAVFSGLSTTFLGLTVTAVATSLPELLATVFSTKQKQDKMVVGNIIGSNIYNLLLIGGIVYLFGNTSVMIMVDWMVFLFATAIVSFMIWYYQGVVVPNRIGIFLIMFYIFYIWIVKTTS